VFGAGGRPLAPIRGGRVRLRPSTPDDLELLVGWFADPEVYRWWGGRPLSRDEVRSKYAGVRSGVDSYVVEATDESTTARPVGYAQSWEDPLGPPDARRGIDLFIAPGSRRRGLGLDAARALVRHLLRDEGWPEVTVDPAADNPVALAFWASAGFRRVRDWLDHPDGPAILMSLDATAIAETQ
jgi:aminoglycoside 6'-N-acetyltransferase